MTHDFRSELVHEWFELSYSNYLVLNRTILQAMPGEWQERFVACLDELRAAAEDVPKVDCFRVHAVDERGRFIADPVPHYRHGRVALKPPKANAGE